MTELVLGLDQGTSSTRCVVLDRDLREHGRAAVPVACTFPRPGWVEQDPEALLASAREAITRALATAGPARSPLPLGIANQTETFVVWERETGRAIYPAIVWQDRRTEAECAALRAAGHASLVRARTGLELDATFPATKLAWVLDHVAGARTAAEAGELAYGDVACWLTFRLTGAHVTDAGNAGRTLLCPLGGADWDPELLDRFGIPRALLPPVVASDGFDLQVPTASPRAAASSPPADAPRAAASSPPAYAPRAAAASPPPASPRAAASSPPADAPRAAAASPPADAPRAAASSPPAYAPRAAAASPPPVAPRAAATSPPAVALRAVAGDQPASLFGLRCWAPGTAKVTLGTGAFLLVHAGDARPTAPDGVLASCAWRRRAGATHLRAGGVRPGGRRGGRLVCAAGRAAAGARARRAAPDGHRG